MLQCLELMNVKRILFLQTMCFVYKLYNRQLPPYLNFTLANEIHDHEKRSRDDIFIEREGEETGHKKFIIFKRT